MPTDAHEEFQRRLDLARNGGGILFCGAGFSADCLNFRPDEKLGTGAQLLNLFNSELSQDPPYKDLKNAADELQAKIGDNGMMALLNSRYTVSEVTSDMTELLRYPWEAIYTTNYDNSLEIAAQAANTPVEALNNTDDPGTETQNLPIIHLHGYVHKWDIHNFGDSCVLGAESYSKLSRVSKWLGRFRRDIDQAQIVVFVGFNAGDFHLNKAINDLTGLREKAFFINRPSAKKDPDVTAAQTRLGTPFFTGRTELAATVGKLLATQAPKEPRLASFSKYTPPSPAAAVPGQKQIENLFLFGEVEPSQLARDLSNGVSEYHILRGAVEEIMSSIADDARIILLEGYPCDGKTLLTTDLAYRMSGTRPVYRLRQIYESVLNEVADILHHAPNAALIIENCFDLPAERLASIARQFTGQEGVLVLTSRAVAIDASPAGLTSLERFSSFRKIPIARLDDNEAHALSELADQIVGWRDFRHLGSGARLRFIQNTCDASLPHFLMRLLRSKYVTDRYREEFNKLHLSHIESAAIITALFIAHIGENAPVSFLSNVMGTDYGAIIDKLDAKASDDCFRIVRRTGEVIQTIPSIGAQNILQNLFDDSDIVDAIVPLLQNLAEIYRNPFEQRMFNQMMRFSILSEIVTESKEIDRFFEHNKQKPQIRRMPLFWLQWHMAKCSEGDISLAEKLLEQGYTEATEYERRTGNHFDRRQLDDRRAKFLMLRAARANRTGANLFRDFKDAIELTEKILRQDDPQRYPFETLEGIAQSYDDMGHRLEVGQKKLIHDSLTNLANYARGRIGVVPAGYQKNKAQAALDRTWA